MQFARVQALLSQAMTALTRGQAQSVFPLLDELDPLLHGQGSELVFVSRRTRVDALSQLQRWSEARDLALKCVGELQKSPTEVPLLGTFQVRLCKAYFGLQEWKAAKEIWGALASQGLRKAAELKDQVDVINLLDIKSPGVQMFELEKHAFARVPECPSARVRQANVAEPKPGTQGHS